MCRPIAQCLRSRENEGKSRRQAERWWVRSLHIRINELLLSLPLPLPLLLLLLLSFFIMFHMGKTPSHVPSPLPVRIAPCFCANLHRYHQPLCHSLCVSYRISSIVTASITPTWRFVGQAVAAEPVRPERRAGPGELGGGGGRRRLGGSEPAVRGAASPLARAPFCCRSLSVPIGSHTECRGGCSRMRVWSTARRCFRRARWQTGFPRSPTLPTRNGPRPTYFALL